MKKDFLKNPCSHCSDETICDSLNSCYYPSDRELLAAKASEIMAEAIRVSERMPKGQWIDVDYLGVTDSLIVYHWVGGEVCGKLDCDIDQPDASRVLDSMIKLMRGFDFEVAA